MWLCDSDETPLTVPYITAGRLVSYWYKSPSKGFQLGVGRSQRRNKKEKLYRLQKAVERLERKQDCSKTAWNSMFNQQFRRTWQAHTTEEVW